MEVSMSTISVNTTNHVSEKILDGAVVVSSVALAAHWLDSPIGAAGGAVFIGVRLLSKAVLSALTSKLLNKDHQDASNATKTLAAVIEFFGSFAAAWGALAAMGLTLTIFHAFSLICTSVIAHIVIALALKCFSPNPEREREANIFRNV